MLSVLSELRGRALLVLIGCVIVQLGLGYGYTGAPLAPYLLEEFGWSRAQLASTRSLQPVLLALSSPVVGFLTVRYGARFVMMSGAVVLGVTYMAGAGVQSWLQLAGMWIAQGLSVAFLGDIAVGAVLSQWTERSRALALGIAYSGANIGGAIAARSLVAIAEQASWRMALFVLGAAALVVILPAALLLIRDRGSDGVAGESGPAPAETAPMPEETLPLRVVLGTRSFWILAFSHVSYWLLMLMVLEHFVLMLEDLGVARSVATAHLANFTLLGGIAKVVFGAGATLLHLSARAAILLDFALLVLSAGLLLVLENPWAVTAFVLFFGFGYAARDVVTPLAIAHCFGVGAVAQVYGLLMLTFLLSPLGTILAGLSFDRTGSYDSAIVAFGTLVSLSFLLLFWLRDERPSS